MKTLEKLQKMGRMGVTFLVWHCIEAALDFERVHSVLMLEYRRFGSLLENDDPTDIDIISGACAATEEYIDLARFHYEDDDRGLWLSLAAQILHLSHFGGALVLDYGFLPLTGAELDTLQQNGLNSVFRDEDLEMFWLTEWENFSLLDAPDEAAEIWFAKYDD